MKAKYILISILAACSLTFTSCELDFDPTDVIKGESVSAENFDQMMLPMYNRFWFDFNDKFYYGLGDGMSYNVLAPGSGYINPFNNLSVTGTSEGLQNAWSSFYIVVQQSNKIMKDIKNNSSVSDEEKAPFLAEGRFMRGLAYWHLVSLWENVILSEDPAKLIENPLVNVHTLKDGYEFAIRDMEYAAKYLPEISKDKGRVNKYSAYGMLSRFYLAYSGLVASGYGANWDCGVRDEHYLDLARKAAEKVILNSSFRLMENYQHLFMVTHNSNPEGVFAFQWAMGSSNQAGWGNTNSQQRFLAFTSELTGGDAWGGYTFCPWNMLNEYAEDDTIRRKATWMGYGDVYTPDNAGFSFTYTQNVASNGDGTTGSNQLNVKKGVTGSSRDNSNIGNQNSALNNYMMRLAEVYLNYAEAILGNNASTTNGEALKYFNEVRLRAGLQPLTSINKDIILKERRIEFCMEGRYWYDLVARSYYDRQWVINYLNGQDRGTRPSYIFTAPNNARINESGTPTLVTVGTAAAGTFRLPYPETDLIKNPKMNQPPVSYEFTEDRIPESELF